MAIRTAVIGYGTGGRVFHAPLIEAEPHLELAAIVTGDAERAASAASRHPTVTVVPDVDALFERGGFDLIVITSPNETHTRLAMRAIDSGACVVLDKPLATSAAEARAVVGAAENAGVPLTVFQNRRWDGDFVTLREAVSAGDVGEVHQFDSAFEWWAPARGSRWKDTATPTQGGGILFDLGPHLIDQAMLLFGDVVGVHAELDRRRGGAVSDDDAFVSLTHETGVRTRLWMSAIAPANRSRFRVVGSEAVFETVGLDPQESQSIAGMRPTDEGFGVHEDGRTALLSAPSGETAVRLRPGRHLAFYESLAGSLSGVGELPVDPRDSVRGLEIIEAALRG